MKIEESGSASGSDSGSGSIRGMDPLIRIHTKMSWICNTDGEAGVVMGVLLRDGGLEAVCNGFFVWNWWS